MVMDRRSELLAWIEKTNRLQRKMAYVLAPLAVLAVVLIFVDSTIGTFAFIGVALFAICAFWVTASHNASHRQKLAELDTIERNGGRPLVTAHRRWHSI